MFSFFVFYVFCFFEYFLLDEFDCHCQCNGDVRKNKIQFGYGF